MQVQVANGQLLQCTFVIPEVQWYVDAYSFASDMKVLPLQHFDIILGMDWLEKFSPMKVHWKHKWMAIPCEGSTAFLQGIVPVVLNELVVHICSVLASSDSPSSTLPP